jgi:hypothetical protein
MAKASACRIGHGRQPQSRQVNPLGIQERLFSAVLTPRDFHDHEEHRGFFCAHSVKKGEEVASACLATLRSLRQLDALVR